MNSRISSSGRSATPTWPPARLLLPARPGPAPLRRAHRAELAGAGGGAECGPPLAASTPQPQQSMGAAGLPSGRPGPRSLPWRTAAVLAAGIGVGLLAAQLAPRLAGLGPTAAMAWVLRSSVSPESSAWQRGTAMERCTARLLSRLQRTAGWSCTIWPSPARRRTSTVW
jgi:hypothetical protein